MAAVRRPDPLALPPQSPEFRAREVKGLIACHSVEGTEQDKM